MKQLGSQEPTRHDEMIFLGVRSLFQFTWPEPQNEDDIRYAAAYGGLDTGLMPGIDKLASPS